MASAFVIMARSLREEEAVRLSTALRETPNILGYRPAELQKIPDCLVAEDAESGETAGVFLAKRLAPDWTDMAVLFVFPEFRRRGIGKRLFAAMLSRLQGEGVNILCVSREPSVLRLMEAAGMQPFPDWRLPFSVQWARSRHYRNLYRFREGIRKSFVFRNQPPFQTSVWRP